MFFSLQKHPTKSELCAGAVGETPSDLMTMLMIMIIETLVIVTMMTMIIETHPPPRISQVLARECRPVATGKM